MGYQRKADNFIDNATIPGDLTVGDDLFMTDDILWATDGGGDIGASGGNRPANIYATTLISTPGQLVATTGVFVSGSSLGRSTGPATGLGSTCFWSADGFDVPMTIGNKGRSDGASNIAIASIWDRNNAAAPTGKIHSFGWTNNSDTYAEVASARAAGLFATSVYATGDGAGVASTTAITNVTAAPDTGTTALASPPTGIAVAQEGWIKIYVGTTAAYVPYWTA